MFAFSESAYLISTTVTLWLCRTGHGSSAVRCRLEISEGMVVVEHQTVPQSSFGRKVTLQLLQMELLDNPGVGSHHHPVVFHLRETLG